MATELPPQQTANVIIAVVGAISAVIVAIVAGIHGARKRDPQQEQAYQPKPYHVTLDERSLDAIRDLSGAAAKMAHAIKDLSTSTGRQAEAMQSVSRDLADHADEVKEHRRDLGELNRTISRKGNEG